MTTIQILLHKAKMQTDKIKRAEQILKCDRVTKLELAEMLGLKGTHRERRARAIIAEVARTKAVISSSSNLSGGYYIDTKDTDEAFVETYNCIMELTSRVKKLMERMQPLERSLTARAGRRGLTTTLDIRNAVDEYRRKLNE